MKPALRAKLAALAASRDVPTWQIERAMALARNTARRWPTQMSEGIDGGDLIAEAMAAAWRHLLTWEPARGSFDTWIIAGCRSACLEALRNADPLSRLERARYREAQRADPNATPPRLILRIEDLLAESNTPERIKGPARADEKFLDVLAPLDEAIEALPNRLDAKRQAAVALAALPDDRQRRIVRWWMAGLTFTAMANPLGLSQSRVHQLWHDALRRMRVALEREESGPKARPPRQGKPCKPCKPGKPYKQGKTCKRGHPQAEEVVSG